MWSALPGMNVYLDVLYIRHNAFHVFVEDRLRKERREFLPLCYRGHSDKQLKMPRTHVQLLKTFYFIFPFYFKPLP